MKKILSLVALVAFAGSLYAQTPAVKTAKVKPPTKKESAAKKDTKVVDNKKPATSTKKAATPARKR